MTNNMQTTSTVATTITKQQQTVILGKLNTYMITVYLRNMIGFSISCFVAYYLADAPHLGAEVMKNPLLAPLLVFFFLCCILYYQSNAPHLNWKTDIALSPYGSTSSSLGDILLPIIYYICVTLISKIASKLNMFILAPLYLIYYILIGTASYMAANAHQFANVDCILFAAAAGYFGLCVFRAVTGRNLNTYCTFAIATLLGLSSIFIAAQFVPSLRSNTLQLEISGAAVIIFSIFIAYDAYKKKRLHYRLAAAVK